MDNLETAFWTILIIGGTAFVFAALAGIAELLEWVCDHD